VIEPREYQVESLKAINDAYAGGIRRPLLVLPTGTGKTVVFAHLLADRPGRGLVLCHRDELIRQAADKLLMVKPDLTVGIVKAKEDEVDALVVVASVQTISRDNRLARMASDFSTVVVDEAHHATADTYVKVLEHLGCFGDEGPLTLGVTATPERGDKQGLKQVWQKIIYQKTILEMILAKYLCDLKAIRVRLDVDFNHVHTRGGDFVEGELGAALEAAAAPKHVASAYQEHAKGRKALVFTPTVKLAHEMAETFRGAGIRAEALDGTTSEDERRAILKRLHTGETMVIANCAVLTEGFDEPSIDCIIVARPTKSKPFYIQMVGRGTRMYPGKPDCLILDVVGVTGRHSLITASEIFDLEIEGQSVTEREQEKAAIRGKVTVAVPGQLVGTPVELFQDRAYRWVQTRLGGWVLPLGREMVRLTEGREGFWRVESLKDNFVSVLREGLPLDYAMGCAEDWARSLGVSRLVDTTARWRSDPATEKQIAALRKWKVAISPGLSKGEASDLLAAVIGGSY
jgi:superfamily II DNA or RNA helicase